MGIFLEGPFTFAPKGGNVVIEDATGKRLCFSRQDFYDALPKALALDAELRRTQSAEITKLSERGPLFLRESGTHD